MSSIFSTDAWDRTRGYDEIGERAFNAIFAFTTMYGLLVYGLLAAAFAGTKFNWIGYIAAFIVSMVGVSMTRTGTVLVDFFGLSLCAGGLGAICGPFIAQYKAASVVDIAFATLFITLVLGMVGTLYPKSLENWFSLLFISLLGLIGAQIVLPLLFLALGLPMKGLIHLLDWVGVLLFSGYVVYDFNRAQHVTKTAENAVDCGVAVFLNIVNLFIRLLELFGVAKTGSDD